MDFTEVESSDIICVDLDGDWSVKIVDNYGNVQFVLIRDNLRDKETIYEVSDIFSHLILPSQTIDEHGNITYWSIADLQNLYILNPLSKNYWPLDEDESCESFSDNNDNPTTKNYFDYTVENF